jgi:L-cysteate sulfo-lyase
MDREQDISQAKKHFALLPRVELGFFPTPLHKLQNISTYFGVDIYMKRDDLTGPGLFGGNKIRKLEFLLGEAKSLGAEYIITYGATQSNHAMQTVTACRKLGLKPVLYLISIVSPDTDNYRGNLLINKIMDAEVHIIAPSSGNMDGGLGLAREAAAERIQELEAEGCRCYEIPVGGANATGTLGFASAYLELAGQMLHISNLNVNYIFHATGTGGTLAGLLTGKKLLGDKVKIIPVDVGLAAPGYEEEVTRLTEKTLNLLGLEQEIQRNEFEVERAYAGPGYESPSLASSTALKLLARKEGILVGPVYTAKALAALFGYLQEGMIARDSRVLFWHTGGIAELFAEAEMVGMLYEKQETRSKKQEG